MNSSFDRTRNGKDEWITPPHIVASLGKFDLDPCAPINRVFDTAERYYTVADNGLSKDWAGRVWCNPPYGSQTGKWLNRLAEHGNGVALVFARTETKMFFSEVWGKADGIFFFRGRIKFHHVDGSVSGSAGAPSCLIAYGKNNSDAIINSGLNGVFLNIKHEDFSD